MAELKVAEIEITQPPPESGVIDTTYKIEGAVKLFDTVGAPPWIYAEAKLKSWLRPEVLEETTYSRGFPIPVTGKFSIGWTPKKEGTYEVTVVATPAPLPLPVIGVPPIIGESDVMEVAVSKTVWEMVEEILGIVIGAGPEVTAWEMVEEILGVVIEAGPEVSVWIMEEEVPGIVVGAGPEVAVWMIVEEVSGIVISAAPVVPVGYTLEVTIEPSGTGSVTKSPDKPTYSEGEIVTLTATPYSGYEFDHWGGLNGATGTSRITTVIMDRDRWVVAAFREIPPPPVGYTLEVSIEPLGTGRVSIVPYRTEYSAGERVTLTAYPDPGYEFDHWGGWPPYPGVGSTSPTIQITMDANWWVVAAFREKPPPPPEPTTYTVRVRTGTPGGTVSKSPNKARYNYGEYVKVTAYPYMNYEFGAWKIDGAWSTSNPKTIRVTEDIVASAYFEPL